MVYIIQLRKYHMNSCALKGTFLSYNNFPTKLLVEAENLTKDLIYFLKSVTEG